MRKLKFLILVVIFISINNKSFANFQSWDSPHFITHQSSQAWRIQGQMGDYLQFAPLIIALGYIIYEGDTNLHKIKSMREIIDPDRYKDDGVSQLAMVMGSSLITMRVLKSTIGRKRPNEWDGNHMFFNYAERYNYDSFPSGHTTMAMAPTFFIAQRYGWLKAIPAIAISTFVGYSRIVVKAHWITDVLAATGMSFLYAYLFTFKRREIGPVTVSAAPGPIGAQFGAGVNLSW